MRGSLQALLSCLAAVAREDTAAPLPAQIVDSEVQWQGQRRTSMFVTMSDGTRLAVDVTLPTRYVGNAPVPQDKVFDFFERTLR